MEEQKCIDFEAFEAPVEPMPSLSAGSAAVLANPLIPTPYTSKGSPNYFADYNTAAAGGVRGRIPRRKKGERVEVSFDQRAYALLERMEALHTHPEIVAKELVRLGLYSQEDLDAVGGGDPEIQREVLARELDYYLGMLQTIVQYQMQSSAEYRAWEADFDVF